MGPSGVSGRLVVGDGTDYCAASLGVAAAFSGDAAHRTQLGPLVEE